MTSERKDKFAGRRFSLNFEPLTLEEVRAVAREVTTDNDPKKRYLSISEAAVTIGRSRLTIERWIKSGRLNSIPVPEARAREPKRLVNEKELLEAEQSARRARGRPRKTRARKPDIP